LKGFLKKNLRAGIVYFVALLLLSHCGGERRGAEGEAPEFSLMTLENQEIRLSDLRGQVVLLDFWATWCGPCRESIPHLVALYKNYQSKGLQVIGLSVDKGDGSAVRKFVQSMGIPYPIALAPEEVVKKYGVTSLPTTVLIDKKGTIREKMVGFSSAIANRLNGQIEELLKARP